MSDLNQDLEMLRKLNESRRHAKELRKQALRPLKQIKLKKNQRGKTGRRIKYQYEDKDKDKESNWIDFERWVAAADDVEIALLVKVQSHREISENESENSRLINASPTLKKVLEELDLNQLLPPPEEAENSSSFPVLLAARAMQALVSRAETVFEPATMYCYYRIIRELYGVAQPNWTVGAARAGIGGTTSAFVTNECIRAIFAFERALQRTYTYFKQTRIFCEYFYSLYNIIKQWDIQPDTPLYNWANKSIEAMWLDCQIATNPRNREMALFHSERRGGENALLLRDLPNEEGSSCIQRTLKYFETLPTNLQDAVQNLFKNLQAVERMIRSFRATEVPKRKEITKRVKEEQKRKQERASEEKLARLHRTETAHLFALRTIQNAVVSARSLRQIVKNPEIGRGKGNERHEKILDDMTKKFYTITRSVHHVLEPSKQYLKLVLHRELAAPPATFDAGELVFAATSYGAINNWRLDDRLSRACELLVNSLPDTGRLPTKRPFHAERRGYRTIPIGCEMTRALATLLQKTSYVFDAKFVNRMLGIFEENFAELHESTAEKKLIGWNFEGAPDPDKPAVWVTAVSVLALDRIVRMLNTRINEVVLAHFDVTKPERPHTQLTLRDLIYSDYALVKKDFHKDEEKFTAIHLQKARAHVMRATLPKRYREDNRNFSTIYYGPPHTGKTTLAESLALSAKVPLLRLSPGDLILQGQELIEGRAHDVFEALSMLTQCVIIFDEFEPVLKNRGNESKSPQDSLRERSQDELKRIGDDLHRLSEKNGLNRSGDASRSSGGIELKRIGEALHRLSEKNELKLDGDDSRSSVGIDLKRIGEALHRLSEKNELKMTGDASRSSVRIDLKRIGEALRRLHEKNELERIGDALHSISEKEDPKFRFVLGGMLPKLIKLHDSAEKQSFAYCLGTNYLAEIDPAAKRKGRFDKKIPVYKPDALSRAGALLYWLSQAKKTKKTLRPLKKTDDKKPTEEQVVSEIQRFTKIIGRTIGQPADRISKFVKTKKSEDGKGDPTATLNYIRGMKRKGLPKELKTPRESLDDLKKETSLAAFLDEEENEKEQREWIHMYEGRFVETAKSIYEQTRKNKSIERLNECLSFEGVEAEKAAKRC